MSAVNVTGRHRAAVANALHLADQAAARGDYGGALAWLKAIEAIGDDLPDTYQLKRATWHCAADRVPAGRSALR
jgi:hypothetical protein